jgi:hypothetical protein
LPVAILIFNLFFFGGRIMKKFVVLMLLLAISGLANATIITLNAVADTDVRSGTSADYAKGDRTWGDLVYVATGISGKVYMKFALPADVGTITSATLTLTTGVVNASSYTTDVTVAAVKDGVAFEDTWTEASPGTYYGDPTGGLTWNNAPGNLVSSGNSFNSATSVQVGTFSMLGGRYGAVVGQQNNLSTQALIDFLNADTNGFVTIMLGCVSNSSAYHGIAANEMGTQPGEKLTITYDPIPEPITIALLSLGLFAIRRKK